LRRNGFASSEALRAVMVEKVLNSGHAQRKEVERVLRATPRHEFVPDADLADASDPWQAVVTHRFDDGRSLSCASAPWLVAAMLDQRNSFAAALWGSSQTRPRRRSAQGIVVWP
jgi:hypothetical protein